MNDILIKKLIYNSINEEMINLIDYLLNNVVTLSKQEILFLINYAVEKEKLKVVAYLKNNYLKNSLKLTK